MSFIGAIIGVAGTLGAAAITSSNAGSNAQAVSQLSQAGADKASQQMQTAQQPYINAGTTALGQLQGMATAPAFSMADAVNSPAEQYVQQQMLDATQKSAAAKGSLLSTNTNQAIQTNAAGIASQYEGQAYQQWLQQQQQREGLLGGLVTVGSNANNLASTTASNATLAAAGAEGSAMTNASNANSNAWSNALGSIANTGVQAYTMSQAPTTYVPPVSTTSNDVNNPSAYVAPSNY